MKILITGGSGFIGTNFIELLLDKENFEFINIDKCKPINPRHQQYWKNCNILHYDKLERIFHEFMPSHIVHLAARADTDGMSLNDYEDNTLGTENIIKVCQNTSSVKKLIITSTQYVFRPGDRKPRHEVDFDPHTVYGMSKVLNELYIRYVNPSFEWLVIRPTNIWGPWHLRYRDQFLKSIYQGTYLHPSKTDVIKSYGFVGNVAEQIHQLLVRNDLPPDKKVYYVGDKPIELFSWVDSFSRHLKGKPVRVVNHRLIKNIALVGDILKGLNINFPLISSRYNNMVSNYITDMDDTFKYLGNSKYNLESGVKITLDWLYNNSNASYIKK